MEGRRTILINYNCWMFLSAIHLYLELRYHKITYPLTILSDPHRTSFVSEPKKKVRPWVSNRIRTFLIIRICLRVDHLHLLVDPLDLNLDLRIRNEMKPDHLADQVLWDLLEDWDQPRLLIKILLLDWVLLQIKNSVKNR